MAAVLQRALVGSVCCRAGPHARQAARQIALFPRRRLLRVGSSRVSAASADVDVALLASELRKSVVAKNVDDARVSELIDALAAARAPANAAAFDGAFEVVWSEGTMAWRALIATAVQKIAGRCRAGQKFDFADTDDKGPSGLPNTALNFAELFGGAVTITANGVFRPVNAVADTHNPDALAKDARYPLGFEVLIAGGDVFFSASGKRRHLPIRGPGAFEVLFGDENVRVFKSSGGIAVQIPSDWTNAPRAPRAS